MLYKISMPNQTSAKYRLVALLLVSILPGTHRLYLGKIKTGLCMLLGPFLLLLASRIFFVNNQTTSMSVMPIIITIILSILIMVWLLWVLIDLSKISLGSFKDINGLTLLRRKNYAISEKSNLTAILLCTLLGFLGVHRFYLGKKNSGLIILSSFLLMFIATAYYSFKGSTNIDLVNIFNQLIALFNLTNFDKNFVKIIVKTYFLICMFWVYIIDTLALLGGVMVDVDDKLPKDFSSN